MITIEERKGKKAVGETTLFVSFPYKESTLDIIK